MLYMATFTINIPHMLAYIPYMDPMGYQITSNSGDFGGFNMCHMINSRLSQCLYSEVWKLRCGSQHDPSA